MHSTLTLNLVKLVSFDVLPQLYLLQFATGLTDDAFLLFVYNLIVVLVFLLALDLGQET